MSSSLKLFLVLYYTMKLDDLCSDYFSANSFFCELASVQKIVAEWRM